MLFELLKKISEDIHCDMFFTGGYVRDLVLNKPCTDYDILVIPDKHHYEKYTVQDIADKILQNFDNVIHKSVVTTYDNKVVINVILSFSDTAFKIVSLQFSVVTQDKRYEFISDTLIINCYSRDFTVNSMFINVNADQNLTNVFDFFTGKEDIKNKVLNTISDSEDTFTKSPIRLMRAFTLRAKYKFKFSKDLGESIIKYKDLLSSCPMPLIKEELTKILLSQKPSVALIKMQSYGILNVILPELSNCCGVTQSQAHHKYDVFKHLVYTCDAVQPDLTLRLAGLLHDIGKPSVRQETQKKGITFYKHEIASCKIAEVVLKRMGFPKVIGLKVLHLIVNHMYHYTNDFTDTAVRRCIQNFGITKSDLNDLSNFPLFKLRQADRKGNGFKKVLISKRQQLFEDRIKKVFEKTSMNSFSLKDLNLNGSDIMEKFDLKPSKLIGILLAKSLDFVIKNPMRNSKDILLKHVENLLAQPKFLDTYLKSTE